MVRALATWAILVLIGSSPPAGSRFVSPSGSAAGDGSRTRPWDLATALAGGGGRIQPGDTVWLRGGTYRGAFRTELVGEPDRHIVMRQYPGERATIDGTLRADGAYLTFWGFEVMQSDPLRTNTYGLEARSKGGRFINLVIHDAGTMGVSFWSPAEGAELYGCVIYNNGTHENLDHGVYVHNERGTKLLADNVLFNNLAYGIHAYAGRRNEPQRGVRIEGNVSFNNGTISRRYAAKGNLLVGGDVPFSGIQVLNNLLYYSGPAGDNLYVGYGDAAHQDAVVSGNFAWGGARALVLGRWASIQVKGNTFGGAKQGASLAGNSYYHRDPPAVPRVFVRPNKYEAGRAWIVVYNWPRADSVAADLSGVLRAGEAFEIRNVQDLFGPPVLRGKYEGRAVALPMGGANPRVPIGRRTAPPPRTGPDFDVFVMTVPRQP